MSVVLRAASGPAVGSGHARRTRAVAQALDARGARATIVVDDAETAARLRAEGFDARADEDWTRARPAAAWLDGFRDWSRELASLEGARTLLVENRTARERARAVLWPALHWSADAWERAHPERALGGAAWIPLAREIEALAPLARARRDVDLLVTFGASDPERSTERALAALEGAALRVAATVGAHMRAREPEIRRLAAAAGEARVLVDVSDLGPWMRRSRAAVTAVGTTLYELAHLRVPAWIVANYASDRDALAFYAREGPHAPIGVARELAPSALEALRAAPPEPAAWPAIRGGADRVAAWLLGEPPPG